jgi:hypothetical protein
MDTRPNVGERLWHEPWRQWVIVRRPDTALPADEVAVTLAATGSKTTVKVRSLHPEETR